MPEIFMILLGCIAFLIVVFPIKNCLEIRYLKKKTNFWTEWLNELPSKKKYLEENASAEGVVRCDFCRTSRQNPNVVKILKGSPKFGMLQNTYGKSLIFKAYICTGCGSQLYREQIQE